MENIKMTEYRETYNELKKNINSENSKVISYLFFWDNRWSSLRKISQDKKINPKKAFMNKSLQKFVALVLAAGVVFSTIAYFLLLI